MGVTMLEAHRHLQDAIERFQRLFHAPHAEHTGHPLNGNRDGFPLGNSRLSGCTRGPWGVLRRTHTERESQKQGAEEHGANDQSGWPVRLLGIVPVC